MKVLPLKQLTKQTCQNRENWTEWNNWNWKLYLPRKSCSKKLNKYVTGFDYIDKIFIVLSTASSGVSIISFTSIVGAPIGIVNASFTLIFSLTTGIVQKLLNITRNKKKKHDKILMLAKSKLNSIETLVLQALIEGER